SMELSEVVQRAIAKRPDDRFQTAEDFADALMRFWPQTRRVSRTASVFAKARARRPTDEQPYLTSAEPGLTVRITGPRDARLSPAAVPVVSAPPTATPASSPRSSPVATSAGGEPRASAFGELPEFADHTEPDALLRLDAQLRDDAEAAAELDALRSPQ